MTRLHAAEATQSADESEVVVAALVEDVLEDPDAADDPAGTEVPEVRDHEHAEEVGNDERRRHASRAWARPG